MAIPPSASGAYICVQGFGNHTGIPPENYMRWENTCCPSSYAQSFHPPNFFSQVMLADGLKVLKHHRRSSKKAASRVIRFVPAYGGALVWDKPLRQPGAKASRVPLDAITQVELEVRFNEQSLFFYLALCMLCLVPSAIMIIIDKIPSPISPLWRQWISGTVNSLFYFGIHFF